MPLSGLGTWESEPGDVGAAVREAVRIGYRHIDCSPIYGNEPEIGQALGELFANGVVERDEVWVTSKLWNDSHTPEHVIPALEQTLADLRLDYLDLYLVEWPVAAWPFSCVGSLCASRAHGPSLSSGSMGRQAFWHRYLASRALLFRR